MKDTGQRNHPIPPDTDIPEPLRLLVAADSLPTGILLRIILERAGYHPTLAWQEQEALALLTRQPFHLVLLDIQTESTNCYRLCQAIRKRSLLPIILLLDTSRPDDIVRGLDAGADDTLVKPFHPAVLQAHIQALMRRVRWQNDRRLIVGDILLDEEKHAVFVRGVPVHLSPTEYKLLRCLMSQPGRPVPQAQMFQAVWGSVFFKYSNLVPVAIQRLRTKLEPDPAHPRYVVTVPRVGYQLKQ
jgi:DNA-binding response OmpR family regulator